MNSNLKDPEMDINTLLSQTQRERSTNELYQIIVVWVSPLTNKLSRRTAYFQDYVEAEIWKKQMEETYTKMGVPFGIYEY